MSTIEWAITGLFVLVEGMCFLVLSAILVARAIDLED